MNPKIAIINYGVGNLFSVAKAFRRFTGGAFITEEAEEVRNADAIVLPGVGAFAEGMRGLAIRGLVPDIRSRADAGVPILGICLGAQILFSKGFEFGEYGGLELIKGSVVKFPPENTDKIPHVGWNGIYSGEKSSWKGSIIENIKDGANMYFVHSYIMRPDDAGDILAITRYGGREFCSAARKGNIYGFQFHPEKSGEEGLGIIKKFIDFL